MHRQIAGKLTSPVTKWIVLAFWLVLLVGSAGFAAKLADVQNNEAASWLPESAESTKALEKLEPFQDPNAIPTVIVYEREGGLTDEDEANALAQFKELQEIKGVKGQVVPPQKSDDGEAMQTLITFDFGKDGWNKMPDAVDDIREIAKEGDGLSVHVAGAGGQASDAAEAFEGIDSTLLFASAGVVIVILLFTYRSPVLWILPIFSVGVALFTAQALIYFLAKNFDLTVNGQSQSILTVLVFGAGTDYALLLIARYREELRRHEDRHEAMAFALHRATPAIIASGATVVVGMLCLLFAEMNSTKGLGPVTAIGVAVALLVMITLLPALLVIFGRWMFWPQRPVFGSEEPTETGMWAKVGNWIKPRPRMVWVTTSVILAISALGFLVLDTDGLSTEESYTKDFDSIIGQRVLNEHKLADTSNPIMVVASEGSEDEVSAAIAKDPGVQSVAKPVVKDGVAFISAPLKEDATAEGAYDAVHRVRDAVHGVDGADALVGGYSAMLVDTQEAASRDGKVIIPIVLVAVLIILMLLLRAVLSPLLLILTVILSFGAALGISSLIFTYIFGFEGADASFPLFVFVFLVALGIDYNIFLMTRVREETMTRGTREGSLVALAATGGVITSAGLVLAATFLVLGSLPLVFLAELGVAVALGVILDTMIVRSVLVTALNLDLGGKIWWPSKLDRGAPPIDPDELEEWAPATKAGV